MFRPRLLRIFLISSLFCALASLREPVFAQAPTELKGHTALVYNLAFSPDGKILASAGFDNVVKLWEYPSGKELREIKGHTGPVYCVAFSPDGKTLASSSHDMTIRLSNVADGKLVREIKGHTGIVDSIAYSPDGKTLASGSADKSVRFWNPADGKEIKKLGEHANSVYWVAFSPDGKTLASAGADGVINTWDVAGQKLLKTMKVVDPDTKSPTPVTSVVFGPDNVTLYSVGFDRLVHVWNAGTAAETKKFGPTPDDLYGVTLSRDGKQLATVGYAGNLTTWNLADGKEAFKKKLKSVAYCVTFSPDGKTLVSGHDNQMIYLTPIGQ
jgi:WD40 repeat protein